MIFENHEFYKSPNHPYIKNIIYGPSDYSYGNNIIDDSLESEDIELYRVKIDDDVFTRVYFTSIAVIGLFILYRLFDKTNYWTF